MYLYHLWKALGHKMFVQSKYSVWHYGRLSCLPAKYVFAYLCTPCPKYVTIVNMLCNCDFIFCHYDFFSSLRLYLTTLTLFHITALYVLSLWLVKWLRITTLFLVIAIWQHCYGSHHIHSESVKVQWKWSDVWPSMVTHSWNLCSAFNPSKCTHTAVNTHTPWTHTRSTFW